MCLFVPSSILLKCMALCDWQGVHFIRVIKNKCPRSALGWTDGHRVNSSLHAPRGSERRETQRRWRRKPDLSSASLTFTSARLSLKDINRYLHIADFHPRFVGFSSQFRCLIPGQRNSTVSLQPLHCQISIGTKRSFNPSPSSRAWLQGSCQPPTPCLARLLFPRGCHKHVVGLGEHTHRHICTCAAKGCVKCVNWLFWDCNLDLTLLCLNFLQELGFSVDGFCIVPTLDLLLIWALALMVSILTVTKRRLSCLFWHLADLPSIWRGRRCRHCREWEEFVHMLQYDWLEFQFAGATQKAWTGIYLQSLGCIFDDGFAMSLRVAGEHSLFNSMNTNTVTIHSCVCCCGPNLGDSEDWALITRLIKME